MLQLLSLVWIFRLFLRSVDYSQHQQNSKMAERRRRSSTAVRCRFDGCSNLHRFTDGFCHLHRSAAHNASTASQPPAAPRASLPPTPASQRPGSLLPGVKVDLWTDAAFPPQPSSIGASAEAKDYSWVRASSLGMNKLYTTAAGANHTAIEPQDVTQGALGDCWLLSAIGERFSVPKP